MLAISLWSLIYFPIWALQASKELWVKALKVGIIVQFEQLLTL